MASFAVSVSAAPLCGTTSATMPANASRARPPSHTAFIGPSPFCLGRTAGRPFRSNAAAASLSFGAARELHRHEAARQDLIVARLLVEDLQLDPGFLDDLQRLRVEGSVL